MKTRKLQSNLAEYVYLGLIEKIESGAYPVGSLLPSCRALSRELGVNKNTINKAFKMLQERELVQPVPGVGTVVAKRVSTGLAGSTSETEIAAALDRILYRARASGVSRKQIEVIVEKALDRWYRGVRLSALLFECNELDARSLAEDVQNQLSIPVTPVVIEDFIKQGGPQLDEYDLLLTTFYHFAELQAILPLTARGRLIGLHDNPSIKSLLAISGIPQGARIGVIAGHERTLHQLERTLESCGRSASDTAVMSDSTHVKRLLESVDFVVSSARCHSDLVAFAPKMPVVTVSFEVDMRSIEFLRKKAREAIQRKFGQTLIAAGH